MAFSWRSVAAWGQGRAGGRSQAGPPSLGIAFSLLLMVFLPWEQWPGLIVWLAIGLVIYFAYGRTHSVLMNAGP